METKKPSSLHSRQERVYRPVPQNLIDRLPELRTPMALKSASKDMVDRKRNWIKYGGPFRPTVIESLTIQKKIPGLFFADGNSYNLNLRLPDEEGSIVESADVSFDNKRQKQFRSELLLTAGIGSTSFRTLGGQMYSKSGKCFFEGTEVGVSTAGLLRISFRSLSESETMEIREIATSCLSPETSISSPSFILHQIVSLVLLRSAKSCKSIFEDYERTTSATPDITFICEGEEFYFDISGEQKRDKIDKYRKAGMNITIIDKYLIADAMFSKDRMLEALIKQSKACDRKSSTYVEELVSKHHPGRENLLDRNLLDFLLKEDERLIEQMASDFEEVMSGIEYKVPFRRKGVIDAKDIPDSELSTLDWLNPKWATKESYKSGRQENWDIVIESDILDFRNKMDSGTHPQDFFDKGPNVRIDQSSFEAMHQLKDGLYYRAANSEIHYYETQVPKFTPPGFEDYYSGMSLGKVKQLKDSNGKRIPFRFSMKPFKTYANIKRLIPQIRSRRAVRNYRDFLGRLRTQNSYIDEVDRKILESVSKGKTIDYLSHSSIYQLLIAFRKVSQTLLLVRSLDGFTTRISHPYFDFELEVFCSGAPLKTDSGVSYVSLLQNDELMKTWMWRAADVKAFSIASNRLVSAVSGLEGKIETDFERLSDLYSLLIFENSWGFSRILKPFRYFSMGCVYGSEQLDQQWKKFLSAVRDDARIWKSKASAVVLHKSMLENMERNIDSQRTAAFGLKSENIGYEIFLINLCSKETYGKRRHRVNMTKEIIGEITLAEQNRREVKKHCAQFDTFVVLYKALSETEGSKEKQIRLCSKYHKQCAKMWSKTDGRFVLSPIGLLLNFKSIREVAPALTTGLTPPLSSLMTTKSSFDGINMRNCSAVESISSLAEHSSLSTTSLIASSILERTADLTFRMFDKDQVGGDREISILSADFRILQSITESISKRLGSKTKIDMLDDPGKVRKLAEAHNNCGNGVRFTVDQTRWGPNFATTLFGYMYAILLRYSTEAWIPMLTCMISEAKIFQVLPYPELSSFQKEGYTLAGLEGTFHMGQGIFHYTSSLWHSVTQQTLGRIMSRRLKLPKGLILRMNFFITSDDGAHFYSLKENSKNKIDREVYQAKYKELINHLKRYEFDLIPFMIKTSTYKNMITYSEDKKGSVEFNSIFLNDDSVGSNALKFHYSLLDPFTSGDRLRDMRRIWDVYSDALNSGLDRTDAEILTKLTMKYRLLQWGEGSKVILALLNAIDSQKINNQLEDIFILLTTRSSCLDQEMGFQCNNSLPHRKYEGESISLKKFQEISQIEKELHEIEVKRENLSKAKARRLGSDRGIVLSKARREMSQIILPMMNRTGAIKATSSGYLASVIGKLSEIDMVNFRTCRILNPSKIRKEIKEGFAMIPYKKGEMIRVSHFDLVYSSYPRQTVYEPDGTLLELLLHISRKKHSLLIQLPDEIVKMNFADRLRTFERLVAESRVSGNAVKLGYVRKTFEKSYYLFEDSFSSMSFYPKSSLLKTSAHMFPYIPSGEMVYLFSFRNKVLDSASALSFPMKEMYVSAENFSPTDEDFITVGRSLIRTDHQYKSLSSNSDYMYLKMELMFEEEEEVTIMSFGNESYEGMSLEEMLEAVGLNLDLDAEPESSEDFLGSKNARVIKRNIIVKIKPHASIISEQWFENEVKMGGILYSMIRQGFVDVETDTEPAELLWSIGTGSRPGRAPRMLSMANIKAEIWGASSKTKFANRASELGKIRQILDVSDSADNFDLSIIGRLPFGVQISLDKPEGIEVSRSELIMMLENMEKM